MGTATPATSCVSPKFQPTRKPGEKMRTTSRSSPSPGADWTSASNIRLNIGTTATIALPARNGVLPSLSNVPPALAWKYTPAICLLNGRLTCQLTPSGHECSEDVGSCTVILGANA